MGENEIAYQMLFDAASRGPTSAIFTTGRGLRDTLNNLKDGLFDSEAEVRKVFNLSDALPLEEAAPLATAAFYMVGGIGGDIFMAEQHLEELQENYLKRSFNDKEWSAITKAARAIYQDLETRRGAQGFGPFDNSYPAEHRVLFDLPKKNNWFESERWKYLLQDQKSKISLK